MKNLLKLIVTAMLFVVLGACSGETAEDEASENIEAYELNEANQANESNESNQTNESNQANQSSEQEESGAVMSNQLAVPENVYPRRIRIEGNYFVVGDDSRRIWINGVNTPWNNWNDFAGDNFDYEWWDEHFAALRANGVNASRVWINCTNNFGRANNHGLEYVVSIDENGMVSGVSERHWENLDSFFEIAARHGIYIMATILSFDHFQYNEWHNSEPERWRNMLQSTEAINSFIEHYTIPFVERYRDNPFLWSIDLMNEPDWVHENEAAGRIEWEYISNFFARNTASIRQNSEILVTVGMAFSKYNSDLHVGNMVSDKIFQILYDNPYAALDFWSPHYYDWMYQWFWHPFTMTPEEWGMCSSKPSINGETTGHGTEGFTLVEDYVNAMNNGWQGVMAWTSSGVDDHGSFDDVITATRHIAYLFPELVWPPN
ncbi:MAG: cellulase (glycosyl hydrolase family 5) [Defluviitaleaceae bacterium]|nr:cellulase (glycosyl hydrolase family 5) [Defluviitaleaceae bacterium]